MAIRKVESVELIGVSNKAISRWENGETFPDIGVIARYRNHRSCACCCVICFLKVVLLFEEMQ